MTTTDQRHCDLTTQAGWDQFKEMLISTLGEDLQGRLNGTSTKTETDANKAEDERQKEQERKHRDHLRRVKELERDNRSRNRDR